MGRPRNGLHDGIQTHRILKGQEARKDETDKE